jgi:glycosyltransferase involved in cell wall biosynthesis
MGQANVDFFDYPLSNRVIDRARGLIVHSEMARQAILGVRPAAPVRLVRMGIPLPPAQHEQRDAARQRLGLPAAALVVGSFGHINPFKRLDVALRAFQRLLASYPNAIYILVGSVSPNYDITQAVRMLGLDGRVRHVGYAGAQAFQDYVSATDICINLRYPSAGETSASVLRLLGAGLPVLVSRAGTFEELPDDCCVKIDVDDCEGELVHEYLRLLAGDAALRAALGRKARRYVAQEHTMEQEAQGYVAALREWYPNVAMTRKTTLPAAVVRAQPPAQPSPAPADAVKPAPKAAPLPPVESAVMDDIAQAAAELGLGESDTGLHDAAQAWVELGRET